jgi:hypothetical protein
MKEKVYFLIDKPSEILSSISLALSTDFFTVARVMKK